MRYSILILVLIALSVAAWPQTETRPKAGSLHTFTSPDGSFQVTYPDMLVRCELTSQKPGEAYYWKERECGAYLSVCGDGPTPGEPLACIAYPSHQSGVSPRLEAAAISFSEYAESEEGCSNGAKKIVEIHGVKFYASEEGDAGLGHGRDSKSYMTFRNGKCYVMVITGVVVTAEIDPPQRQLTKRDWAEIYRPLGQTRDSVRFLK